MTQIPLSQTASADRPEYDKLRDDKTRQIAPDVAYRQIAIVNVVFFGQPRGGRPELDVHRYGDAGRDLRPPIRRAGAIWRGVETFNTDERWSEAFRKMQLTNCGAAAISRCVITRGGIRETAH
jgi:hypothetical protein